MDKKTEKHFSDWCKKNSLSLKNVKILNKNSVSFQCDKDTLKNMKSKIDKEKYSLESNRKGKEMNVILSRNITKVKEEIITIVRKVVKENASWKPMKQPFIDNFDGKKGEYKQCERNALMVYNIMKKQGTECKLIRGALKLEFNNLPSTVPELKKSHVVTVDPHYWVEIMKNGERTVLDITPFMMPHPSCPAGNADAYIFLRTYIPDVQLTENQIENLINIYMNTLKKQ